MSIIGVIIFAGLTAYDTQVIKEIYVENENSEDFFKKSSYGCIKVILRLIIIIPILINAFWK